MPGNPDLSNLPAGFALPAFFAVEHMNDLAHITAASAPLLGRARARHALVQRFLDGQAVTLLDQIGTLACLGEVEGFEDELARQGRALSGDEAAALARVKIGLKRQSARSHS